jgi:hypothetical protein
MDSSRKEQGSQGIPLLDSAVGLEDRVSELEVGGVLVAPRAIDPSTSDSPLGP